MSCCSSLFSAFRFLELVYEILVAMFLRLDVLKHGTFPFRKVINNMCKHTPYIGDMPVRRLFMDGRFMHWKGQCT